MSIREILEGDSWRTTLVASETMLGKWTKLKQGMTDQTVGSLALRYGY